MAAPALASLLLAVALVGASARPALADPRPPAPPSPSAPGPITHPGEDGGHAGSGQARGRDAGPPSDLPRGVDVSAYQGEVDWTGAKAAGAQFAYVKASEGTTYLNPQYRQQYNGAVGVGMVRGAYHFALPDRTSAAEQAGYFVDHGGTWTADGKTLPPMIDIEDNPYGAPCYGLSAQHMTAWIRSFSDTVHTRTGRFPTIYTSARWWKACTGDSNAFGTNALFVAHYAGDAGPMPGSWQRETIWQYDDTGEMPGDQDIFRGTPVELKAFAAGTALPPTAPAPATATTTPAPATATTTPAPATATTMKAPASPGRSAAPSPARLRGDPVAPVESVLVVRSGVPVSTVAGWSSVRRFPAAGRGPPPTLTPAGVWNLVRTICPFSVVDRER